ncbi:ABC1 kinase family protein [Tropicimonas sp. S265A]|uniref:ABC1 kinase family protein n=1 Tax=Tropicimonas sp. S265A TaxID=3415134 RepID=UPI003C7AFA55
MTDTPSRTRARAVPASRTGRLLRLGGAASTVAGALAVSGAGALMRGERPEFRDLLLTPANVGRITDELARMRGAAMKVGQLVSLDAGEVLPPELAEIMARLRADADYMPPRQLREVLTRAWGSGWTGGFARFDVRPIAAASIGQVHRALTKDGRDLAIKVQYPGIRRSIDSDVTNVGALIRMSGLLPRGLEIGPLLEEAKRQLHEEADYAREAVEMTRFGMLLKEDPSFCVPEWAEDLSTETVLAMTYLPGTNIDSLLTADQDTRDRTATQLIDLVFRELFEFGYMQTDPNFANYRYDPDSAKIILLDFGAARPVPTELSEAYAALFSAALTGQDLAPAALELGFFDKATAPHHKAQIISMMTEAFAPMRTGEILDFGDRERSRRLTEQAMEMAEDPTMTHIPPVETLFLQRKFAGMYLLASRLRARVDVAGILARRLPAGERSGAGITQPAVAAAGG